MLEILVSLAILALLAGLSMVAIDTIHQNAAKAAARLMVNDTFQTALTTYKFGLGDFPSTTEGLRALTTAPAGRTDRWSGPYMVKIPLDPWGEPYRYAYPGKHNKKGYDVWSAGRDKVSGTDDDIVNWEKAPGAEP